MYLLFRGLLRVYIHQRVGVNDGLRARNTTTLPELEDLIRAVIEITNGLPSVMILMTFPAHTILTSCAAVAGVREM